jgi:nucleolar protein 6
MADTSKKLSKKQLKAHEFRNKKKHGVEPESKKRKQREHDDEEDASVSQQQPEQLSKPQTKPTKKVKSKTESQLDECQSAPVPKTKAKPTNRFIVFIGNLPYDCTADDIQQHFKAAQPAAIRPRKGFAFAEFAGTDATKKLNVALRLHHSMLKTRKINVELTAGGGGNSENRRNKLRLKNDKLRQENAHRIAKEEEVKKIKDNNTTDKEATTEPAATIHPSRLKLIKS